MTIAYSYLRFSSPQQATGGSLNRQLRLAEQYAAAHHLTLDRTFTLHDLGVSAYRGRNAKSGALSAFLNAIERGLISPGSYLLVENLDRLSRERVLEAQGLFLQIVQAGVVIVTLTDQRAYSTESINANPTDLIISLVTMMRANDESAIKSARYRASWAAKRAAISERPITAHGPTWLRFDRATARFIAIDDRVAIIRRIYRDWLAGHSVRAITRQLNKDGIPLFSLEHRPSRMWHQWFVTHLLTTPTVIGTFTPHISEHVAGKRVLRPQSPVAGYYPAVIDAATWHKVQRRRAELRQHRAPPDPPRGVSYVLAGLARCCHCGDPLLKARGRSWTYLTCSRARLAAGCVTRYVRYAELERLFTHEVVRLIASCPPVTIDPAEQRQRLAEIATELRALRQKRSNRVAPDCSGLPISSRQSGDGVALEADINRLRVEQNRLRAGGNVSSKFILASRLKELEATASEQEIDALRVNAALRNLLTGVVVDQDNGAVTLHWRHGSSSTVAYQPLASRRAFAASSDVSAPIDHVR